MPFNLQFIDSAPLADDDFSSTFNSFVANLVDTENENIQRIQDGFNFLSAPPLTQPQIVALGPTLPNGIFLYSTTTGVYVGKQAGTLVQFTTTPFP